MSNQITIPENARYTFGGDEFLLVEIEEAMSLEANMRAVAIARALQDRDVEGIIEICPANASLLIRCDPDVIHPHDLRALVQELEEEAKAGGPTTLDTRIIEIPVWYQDEYTDAVVRKYREGYHQDPSGTDVDYAAAINGLSGAEEFVQRHHEQPWMVTMVGFVAGLPFMFQLADPDKQMEVPKYLSPRPAGTPALTVGHGGAFGVIYSVEGAGGYQMIGIAAGPIFDPEQRLSHFDESMLFFRHGDIVKFTPIDGDEYRRLRQQVDDGTFAYRTVPVQFDSGRAVEDREGYNRTLMEALNGR